MAAELGQLVADYLVIRRALGFQLKGPASILARYLAFLDGRGEAGVTVDNALAFAQADPGLTARGKALRMSAIRCFARWANAVDPQVQVPPARLLPARPTRPAPFIYTSAQIGDLLAATDRLAPAMLAASMRTLIGLMAATGIRTGEALGLRRIDWDHAERVLSVTGEYAKTRALPVHPSVASALAGYLEQRRSLGMSRSPGGSHDAPGVPRVQPARTRSPPTATPGGCCWPTSTTPPAPSPRTSTWPRQWCPNLPKHAGLPPRWPPRSARTATT